MASKKKSGKSVMIFSLVLLTGVTFAFILYAQENQKRIDAEWLPTEKYPENYWSHTELPQLTNEERLTFALEAQANWEGHCREANERAEELSDKLEDYIRAWLRGEVDAKLPKGLLPEYIDTPKTKDWTLMKPEEVDPEKQWYIIPAHETDPEYKKLYMLGVSGHGTYAKLLFVAPLGSKLLIDGDFPHARFMDFQILQPFDPEHPASGCIGENPEVPIVDVDIKPDPGHTNPFRAGANRNAVKRHYHLTFKLQAGNAVALNPQAMTPPAYRARGNTRVGGPFGFAGPYGGNVFTPSVLWQRIFVPDKGTEPLGGVSLPKAMLQLSTGEKFWLQPDASLAIERQTTQVAAGYDEPKEPYASIGPSLGWFKIFGPGLIRAEFRGYLESEPWGEKPLAETKKEVRDVFSIFFNRGSDASPPGNYEATATACTYTSYLTRMFQRGPGKVYVITGKLPTTPKTRNGEPKMTKAEARYWSISRYGKGEGDQYETAVHYGGLRDDEIIVNENNEYIIVYSPPEDRPANAISANGVTWQDWGPRAHQTITIRWMSVRPDWHLPEFAPDEDNIPWETGAWSAAEYDKSLVGKNEPGVMGPYHPVIHYMTKEGFEALGDKPINPKDIPKWTSER